MAVAVFIYLLWIGYLTLKAGALVDEVRRVADKIDELKEAVENRRTYK